MEKTQNFKNTVFACYRGYITQGIVNNLSPLFFVLFQNKFGISYSLISALILCNFVTQVITDMLSVKYVDRIGYRKSAVIAHALAFLGLVMQGHAAERAACAVCGSCPCDDCERRGRRPD